MGEGKTKSLLIVKLNWSSKIYNVSLLTATYSCKFKNVFTNAEPNILKSDVNWVLNICNNNLPEIEIKISIGLSIETYSNLKIIDMMVIYEMWIAIKSDNLCFLQQNINLNYWSFF